jgi:uncharacterized protein YggU (UPF0235/DUF167 family)
MKIVVKAKVNAKKESVERLTERTLSLLGEPTKPDIYKVSVKEPAVGGKANKAIVKAIANYFDVASSLVSIVSGLTSKTKIIEIQK